MLFNKTISTLIACGAVGAAIITPLQSQAISYMEGQYKPKTQMDNFNTLAYSGEASWYGPGFYGNLTANGEVYRPGTMTAAHRYLPFGTRVRVTNLNNGRSAVVRINDRGPYVGGRVIDLSEGAASVLGVKSSGVAPVRLQVLD